jgi:hypothetical protein
MNAQAKARLQYQAATLGLPIAPGGREEGAPMSRRKPADSRHEITVFPRGASEQLGSIPPPESGLSVDTEDIGSQFLSSATEQGVADWSPFGAGDDPLADGGLDGEGGLGDNFELDPFGWERATTRSLRIGKLSSNYPPATGMRKKPQEPGERPAHAWDEIDLTDEAIQEASLLDHEGVELGEVESPLLRTDDTHTHGRRRGGHLRNGRRKRA